jgi:hypothetical protein
MHSGETKVEAAWRSLLAWRRLYFVLWGIATVLYAAVAVVVGDGFDVDDPGRGSLGKAPPGGVMKASLFLRRSKGSVRDRQVDAEGAPLVRLGGPGACLRGSAWFMDDALAWRPLHAAKNAGAREFLIASDHTVVDVIGLGRAGSGLVLRTGPTGEVWLLLHGVPDRIARDSLARAGFGYAMGASDG